LLQVAAWGVAALTLSGAGVVEAARAAGLELGPHLGVVVGLYFLLGYFFYACLMSAVGALAPSFKESGALTFVVLFPAWTPFFAVEAILAEPDGVAARAFTLLPPTAPLVGVMRSVMVPVPATEIAASLALLAAAGGVVLWLATRLFAAQVLLATAMPSPGLLVRALRGRL
jgi:ABC-2 type transport system permease protein